MPDAASLHPSQGQLGLGEDTFGASSPRRLSAPQLAGVTRIQAGDSYSAAVTGEAGSPLRGDAPPPEPNMSAEAETSHGKLYPALACI